MRSLFQSRTWLLVEILVLIPLIFLMFNNCGRFSIDPGLASSSSVLPTGASPVQWGKDLYNANCVSCHGPIETSTKIGKSASDIEHAIATQPAMAHLNFLSTDEVAAIAAALDAPMGTTSGLAASFQVVATNRYALASTLQEFFVADVNPNSDDATIQGLIQNFVVGHPEAFGGNCSRNDPGCIPQPCGDDSTCTGVLAASQAALPVPGVSPIRKGYMIQVCEQILAVDRSVQNMVGKAGLDATKAPTGASIATLMSYAAPGRTPDPTAVTALAGVAAASSQAGQSVLDQWRFVILPICESTNLDLL